MTISPRNTLRYLFLNFVFLLIIPQLLQAEGFSISNKKSFLWEVQSKTATAYILGSIHFADKSFYPLNKKIEDAFNSSSNLVVELNPLAIDEEKMGTTIIEKGIYKNNVTIQDNISSDTLELLEKFLIRNSIPFGGITKMKPSMLAFMLSTMKLMQMGYTPEYGIDMYFCKKAEGVKSIVELETVEKQLSLIFDMPNGEAFLEYTLLDLQKIDSLFSDIISAWKNGDGHVMEKVLFESHEDRPEFKQFFEKIYFDRNLLMVSKIKTMLKKKQTFFVIVGAGHLVGEKGIIQLLADPEYDIQQL
jgi:uncharacterized protein